MASRSSAYGPVLPEGSIELENELHVWDQTPSQLTGVQTITLTNVINYDFFCQLYVFANMERFPASDTVIILKLQGN